MSNYVFVCGLEASVCVCVTSFIVEMCEYLDSYVRIVFDDKAVEILSNF